MQQVVVKTNNKRKYIGALRKIEQQYGVITPQMVVDAAKPMMSPLHSIFEWDDTEAAKRYRLVQARLLLNHVRVEVLGKETNGFVNALIQVESVQTRGYVSTDIALTEEYIYQQVLSTALRELQYWRDKYKTLKELSDIINTDKLDELLLTTD